MTFNLFSQSNDPPTGKIVIEGEGHAVLKVDALNYQNDSTEIKLKNMNASGVGTEFVLKSLNEQGLSINSNSDLSANTRDSIMHFDADGDVYIGDFKGGGIRPLFTDDNGKIVPGCPTKFTTFATNAATFTTTSSGFEPVGTVYNFTKDCNPTKIKIRLSDRMFYDEVNEVAALIQIRVDGLVPDYVSNGSVWDGNTTGSNRLNTWYSTESIYENLASGSHTLQMYVSILSGGDGTIDPGNFSSSIIVEESH